MSAQREQGTLIAFEGIDGSGKSSQVDPLAAWLRERGHAVTVSAEPTAGPHGQALRDAWRAGQRLPVEEELDLFEADRRDHVTRLIRPALNRGETVLIDRYYYSSAAYQGTQPGQTPAGVLSRFETFCPRPDLVLLFDLPVDEALRRMTASRSTLDAMEAHDNLLRVRQAFRAIDRPEFVRIDATRPMDEVRLSVREIVRERLRIG